MSSENLYFEVPNQNQYISSLNFYMELTEGAGLDYLFFIGLGIQVNELVPTQNHKQIINTEHLLGNRSTISSKVYLPPIISEMAYSVWDAIYVNGLIWKNSDGQQFTFNPNDEPKLIFKNVKTFNCTNNATSLPRLKAIRISLSNPIFSLKNKIMTGMDYFHQCTQFDCENCSQNLLRCDHSLAQCNVDLSSTQTVLGSALQNLTTCINNGMIKDSQIALLKQQLNASQNTAMIYIISLIILGVFFILIIIFTLVGWYRKK